MKRVEYRKGIMKKSQLLRLMMKDWAIGILVQKSETDKCSVSLSPKLLITK